ncbi:SDR family NAD(P)-dependent oxidoreductase [Gordonia sp. NPDC003376]
MSELSGKRVFVTGSGAGIGEAISALFIERGASVVVSDRDETAAASTATGSGAEIGEAISALFIERGASVVVSDRDETAAASTATEIGAAGVRNALCSAPSSASPPTVAMMSRPKCRKTPAPAPAPAPCSLLPARRPNASPKLGEGHFPLDFRPSPW